jgi:hypothetical protein
MAEPNVDASGAKFSSARRARAPSFGAESDLKTWAPPYTVWTGCRRAESPG